MRALLCCLGLLLALPASANSIEASVCRVRQQVAVERMDDSEKLCRSFVRALAQMPETAAEQARGMFAPESLEAMAVVTAAWMGSQGIPVVGQAVDAALLALGATLLAAQMGEVAKALWDYANLARLARSERELDEAASHLSKALATAGVNLVGFILTKRAVSRLGSGPSSLAPRLSTATGRGSPTVAVAGAAEASSSAVVAADVVVMATGPNRSTAGTSSTSGGPGRWEPVTPSGSERSQAYQQKVTGRPATQIYKVNGVEFDGFENGVLLEAKGPGYASFIEANGQPKYWYNDWGKFDEMMRQASRQSQMAEQVGLPLRWHVAEAELAAFLRQQFRNRNLRNIEVVHTPMSP
jgi:hypothetical protein